MEMNPRQMDLSDFVQNSPLFSNLKTNDFFGLYTIASMLYQNNGNFYDKVNFTLRNGITFHEMFHAMQQVDFDVGLRKFNKDVKIVMLNASFTAEEEEESESVAEQNDASRLLNDARSLPVVLITRPLTYGDKEPLSYETYNYQNIYYQINEIKSSIYAYNELKNWLATKDTDPLTREHITSIRKIKFVLPRFEESNATIASKAGLALTSRIMGTSRRRSFGGGKRKLA